MTRDIEVRAAAKSWNCAGRPRMRSAICGRGAVVTIELEEQGKEAVLGLTVSDSRTSNGASTTSSDQELARRRTAEAILSERQIRDGTAA